MKKVATLENYSITNLKVLTGYINGDKVWTAPIVSKDKKDKLKDKLGNEFKLGQMYTGITDLTPKSRADRYTQDTMIARYLFLSSIPLEGKNEGSSASGDTV
jgi:hypothetical protein